MLGHTNMAKIEKAQKKGSGIAALGRDAFP